MSLYLILFIVFLLSTNKRSGDLDKQAKPPDTQEAGNNHVPFNGLIET